MELSSPEPLLDTNPVRVRPANLKDLPGISKLMAQHDMYGEFLAEECVVAEVEGRLCGFARVEVVGGQPYLRPIVVDSRTHGRGVGTALLRYLLDRNASLIAISRGSAVGFYVRMGFESIEWKQIYAPFQQECLDCPDLGECQPQPMMVEINSIAAVSPHSEEGRLGTIDK